MEEFSKLNLNKNLISKKVLYMGNFDEIPEDSNLEKLAV